MDRRPSKRLRTATYHDRVDLTDDFEVVHARETVLRQHTRLPVDTPRSPQKGRTTWTHGNSWVPEDSFEFALDPDGDWYDEQVEQPILETTSIPAEPPSKIKKRKKKSKVSVRKFSFGYVHMLTGQQTSVGLTSSGKKVIDHCTWMR